MAEYIERGAALAKLTALEVTKPSATMADAKRLLADMPAADVAPVVHVRWIEREEKPICRSCNFMRVTSYAKTTGNNRHLKGSRGNCMCDALD